jgi:hypothetical protein
MYSTSLFSRHTRCFSLCVPFLNPFHFQDPSIIHAISFLVIGHILSYFLQHSYFVSRHTEMKKKYVLKFFRISSVFLCHYIYIPLVIIHNWLASGACRLYRYIQDLYSLDHLNFLCPSVESHIIFMPFLTVSDKVLNIHMHSWLPIFSCQPHHFSLPPVRSWLHFCHNTHCSPAPLAIPAVSCNIGHWFIRFFPYSI